MSQMRAYETEAFVAAIEPQSVSSTQYNGSSATTVGIDTQGYDGASIILSTGTFTSSASVAVSMYEGDANDSSLATLIPGASFSTVDTGCDDTVYQAYIEVCGRKRYLFVKTVATGAGATPISATAVLDRYQKRPILARASLSFCVDSSV